MEYWYDFFVVLICQDCLSCILRIHLLPWIILAWTMFLLYQVLIQIILDDFVFLFDFVNTDLSSISFFYYTSFWCCYHFDLIYVSDPLCQAHLSCVLRLQNKGIISATIRISLQTRAISLLIIQVLIWKWYHLFLCLFWYLWIQISHILHVI